MEREIVKTKKITGKEMRIIIEERRKEKARRIALLDVQNLTEEEKNILVGIKMGLEDIEAGREYTMEETMEILFGDDGLCT